MKNQITIEQLAQHLGKTVWTKGDVKRIYLNDVGYNTKKMSTKTYIWQDVNGDFQVTCNIECPSQADQWINSQEEMFEEQVHADIDNAIAQMNAVLVEFKMLEETPGEVMVYVKENTEAEPAWFTEDIFWDKFGCTPYELFKEIPKPVYQPQPTITETPAPINEPKPIEPRKADSESVVYPVNATVKHSKFGLCTVIEDGEKMVKIELNDTGEIKTMIKQFVKLEIVEA